MALNAYKPTITYEDVLEPSCRSFRANHERLVALILFAPACVHLAQYHQLLTDCAIFNVFGSVDVTREQVQGRLDEVMAEKERIRQGLWDKMEIIIGESESRDESGASNIDAFRDAHSLLPAGKSFLYSSIVTGAWTMFEALSVDLWRLVLNKYPNPFAATFARAPDQKGQSKQIAVTTMSEYANDFNLSAMMGDIFIAEQKADFRSLESTKWTYRRAFDCPFSMFDDPQLRLLELVRNLSVHNGGIVDQKFLDRLTETGLISHPDCAGIKMEQAFPISGPLTAAFIIAATSAVVALIEFVSKLIKEKAPNDGVH